MKTTMEQFRKFLDKQSESFIHAYSIESDDKLTVVKCKANTKFSAEFSKWQEKHSELSLQQITKNVFAIVWDK